MRRNIGARINSPEVTTRNSKRERSGRMVRVGGCHFGGREESSRGRRIDDEGVRVGERGVRVDDEAAKVDGKGESWFWSPRRGADSALTWSSRSESESKSIVTTEFVSSK